MSCPPDPPPGAPSLAMPSSAAARIFTALTTDLRRTARRLTGSVADADDLVQDTLLRVWARMAMADDSAPVEDLRAYAFATMRHRASHRSFRRAPMPSGATSDAADIAAPRGSDGVTRLACAEALDALAALPREQQSLLRLRAMEGLSYAQIARRTGLPLGTVTSRMARGRAAMRLALDLPPGAPVTDLLGEE